MSDRIRAQEILLELLENNLDTDCLDPIMAPELRGCYTCAYQLAATYLGMAATLLTTTTGGTWVAARAVREGLAEDLAS